MKKNKKIQTKSKRKSTSAKRKPQIPANKRAYDIAKTFPSSDWVSATKNSPNADTKAAIGPGREKARTLAQNAPYAVKAIDVIVNETVGAGIIPQITGKNKSATKKLNDLWKKWAESTDCDFEGQNNYYGLQELAFRSTVEAGEGLALKKFDKTGPKIQLIEPDFIATSKDDAPIVQGIELDSAGRRKKIHIYKTHPGDKGASDATISLPITEIAHVYKKKRAGQQRGVTWAHAVVEKLKDFDDYAYATIVRQKTAACFGGVITTNPTDEMIDPELLKARRESMFQMEPNSFRFLQPGESLQLIAPPNFDDANFVRETLQAIAGGFGISYEALTGDYSRSNYSSSRMGQLQMRKNIESWRWNMFIPQFCEITFKWFLEWAQIQGIDTTDVKVKWVPPAYSQIDPTKEIASLQKEVRSGFKSYGEALQEMGRDPEQTIIEIAEWNQKFDELKVTLDIDPRRMSQIGFAQAGDSLGKLSPDSEYLQDEPEGNNGQTKDETDVTGESDTSTD